MTELLPKSTEQNELAITEPELLTVMEVLEAMQPIELRAHKLKMLHEISDREAIVRMINDTLDGYGVI